MHARPRGGFCELKKWQYTKDACMLLRSRVSDRGGDCVFLTKNDGVCRRIDADSKMGTGGSNDDAFGRYDSLQ